MSSKQLYVLLADDDPDDCMFFKRALEELPLSIRLTTVYDGERLIKDLAAHPECLPDVIFLDLSMPRKTGFECLAEIKQNVRLKDIPVFVFSTSFTRDLNYERNMIGTLSSIGAEEYIRKPGDFGQLKKVIHRALIRVIEKNALIAQTQIGDSNKANGENIHGQPIKI